MVAKIDRISRCFRQITGRLLLGLWLAAAAVFPVCAETGFALIGDDETEQLLHEIIKPLFKAAGVPFDPRKVFILNDNSLNAFVSNGNYLFIHTGTLLHADNVNQISGVLAHETGHIAGGHIARQKLQIDKMQTMATISLIAAGAVAAASGRSDAAMAVMLGSQSTLFNAMTAYQFQDERSADESAVRYLEQTGQSPVGLKSFIRKIQAGQRLSGYEEQPWFRTHPMSAERLEFFDRALATSTGSASSPLDQKFQQVKAKLSAFLLPVRRARQLYPASNKTEAGKYAHAILEYREGKISQALQTLDTLIRAHPQNPYYHELKGQFLLETGQVEKAEKAYGKALKLNPNAFGTISGWARAALELPPQKRRLNEIIHQLNRLQRLRPTLSGWLLLSRACQEAGRTAESLYAAANYSAITGNIALAYRQIDQALKEKPSPELKTKLADLKNALATANDTEKNSDTFFRQFKHSQSF